MRIHCGTVTGTSLCSSVASMCARKQSVMTMPTSWGDASLSSFAGMAESGTQNCSASGVPTDGVWNREPAVQTEIRNQNF